MYMSAGAPDRQRHWSLLGAEATVIVSHSEWVLGIELGSLKSSVGAAHALCYRTLSPVPTWYFFDFCLCLRQPRCNPGQPRTHRSPAFAH